MTSRLRVDGNGSAGCDNVAIFMVPSTHRPIRPPIGGFSITPYLWLPNINAAKCSAGCRRKPRGRDRTERLSREPSGRHRDLGELADRWSVFTDLITELADEKSAVTTIDFEAVS
jgi:hypothetical protein